MVQKANKEQQNAIDTYKREGAFLILAGPGTGKTFTISQRIKEMIESGISPDKILCLTFSETAASEMKKGLEKALGQVNTNINIYTYHSFCLDVIQNNPDIFGINNIKIITDTLKTTFMKECIDERITKHKDEKEPTTFTTEKNGPYHFIDKILERIEEIKKYRLNKDKYFDNIKNNPDWQPLVIKRTEYWQQHTNRYPQKTSSLLEAEKKVAQAEEVWELYELYKSKMQKKNFLDFGDMISLVLDEFENNETFTKKIASNYDYIIADEYQDTNIAQNEILFNLANNMNKKNIFVVGDDDQIIYTFQGARLDSVKNFIIKLNVKENDVICFKKNMRSTEKILNVARQIILQDDISLEKDQYFKNYNISKELIASNKDLSNKNKDVRCLIYRDALQEKVHIIEEIKELINSPNCPRDKRTGEKKLSEIAILTRTNDELTQYGNLLQSANIPYETAKGKNLFDVQSFIIMFLYMQFLANSSFYNDSFFKMILSKPFNINENDYEFIYTQKNSYNTFIDCIREYKNNGYLYKTKIRNKEKTIKFSNPERLEKFINTYDELKDIKQTMNLKDTILAIGNKTGIFEYYFNNPINRSENISGIKKLVELAESFSDIEKPCSFEFFIKYIEDTMNADVKIYTDKPPVKQNAIQLVTYHGSKGMEFEYVYIPYLIKKKNDFENPIIPLSIEDDISKDSFTGKNISDDMKNKIKKANLIKLIYVAMTRAKHSLYLSYTKINNNGQDIEPLDLLTTENIIKLINPQKYEQIDKSNKCYEEEIIKFLTVCDRDYEKEFNEYIKNTIYGKAYSVSKINGYISCPRQYLYTNIFGLEAKTRNADKAHFGTAIHAAYEYAINMAIEQKVFPTKSQFIQKFNDTLISLPISSKLELKRMLNDGSKVLCNIDKDGDCCYDRLRMTPVEQLYKTEHSFNFDIDGELFTGKIDRIDKLPDNKYIIYEYKTGDRQDEKQISPEGNHSDYYNQMAIYKHFLCKELNCDYDDISTIFIFPREYKKPLELRLSKENCIEILDKFKKAIFDIKSLKFNPNKTETSCRFCPYKKSYCNLNII